MSIFAGQLSTEAQAGIAIGFRAFFIMMAVGFGLGSGRSAPVSNVKGAKNTLATSRLAAQGLRFGAITYVTLMIAGWFSICRQGSGVAFFSWVFIALLGFDVWGVWLGVATVVSTGWIVAMIVAARVLKAAMGGVTGAAAE
jgi:Na+-driven multidrug efflux pump